MRKIFILLIGLFPFTAFAYDTLHLPYTDAPRDRVTAVAVSALTEEGILQGYPDGTFRPEQHVNRAEFTKVLMMVLGYTSPLPAEMCFPDVQPDQWYAAPVCLARELGFVQGNGDSTVPREQWLFVPERTVNYAEAVKILVLAFDVPQMHIQSDECYEPFLAAAVAEDIALPGVDAAHALTRGEVAQITVSFLAWSRGELMALRAVQSGEASSSSISSSSRSSAGRSSSASSVSSISSVSSASSASSFATDPGPDFSQTPSFLRLGTVSPILGAAKIFNNSEPFTVEDITVTFTAAVPSVDQVRLYASADGRYLGGASRDTDDPASFTLHSASGLIAAARREGGSGYARAITRRFDQGGESGEDIEIDTFTIEGRGDWSHSSYSDSSTETYQAFETARSTFTSIANAGPGEDALVGGVGRTIGQWRLQGGRGDGSADLLVTDITFALGTSGGVTLANVTLGADGSTDRTNCSVVGTSIVCAAIPEGVGTVTSGTRVITLRGDITIPSASQSAGLQISITPAGSVSSAGALTWTDGTTSFSWVPFTESQLQGTYYWQ